MGLLTGLVNVEQARDDLASVVTVANIGLHADSVMGVVTLGHRSEPNHAAVVHPDLGRPVGGDLGLDLGAYGDVVGLDFLHLVLAHEFVALRRTLVVVEGHAR